MNSIGRRLMAVRIRSDDLMLAGSVTLLGLVLRIEALVASYGTIPLGHALEALQRQLAAAGPWLHGGRLAWDAVAARSGDPVAYLNNARAMTWFYEGRAREPVFNYATKLWLAATGDADIAVSAASVTFSALCVPATYTLGRLAAGRVAGLAAAAIVAVDGAMIGWGIQGWRDDAFTFFLLAFATGSLLFSRNPSWRIAAAVSCTAALAMLTRLTAVSFIAPALLLLAIQAAGSTERRAVRTRVAGAAALAAVLVAPYLVNCWLEFGDPLVAINRNTTFYRERAGLDASANMRVDRYLGMLLNDRPIATIDTAVQGVTSYPFRNKFQSLEPWGLLLPAVLRPLALVGMLAWPWSAPGRLLLVILVSSLVPYAFTWQIEGGAEWRFTMHAYPFYLMAAAGVLPGAATLAWNAWEGRPLPVGVLRRTAVSIALAAGVAAPLYALPYPRAREALVRDGRTTISPGWGDWRFFSDGWEPSFFRGQPLRSSAGGAAALSMPLPAGSAWRVTIWMEPTVEGRDRTPLLLRTSAGGRELALQPVSATGDDPYVFDVPAGLSAGEVTIEFRASRTPSDASVDLEAPAADPRFTIASIVITRLDSPLPP